MTTTLGQETVKALFEHCTHQGEVLEGLYRMVFPEWDRITSIKGYPQVNDATWKQIAHYFMGFDANHHPDVLAGGAWMNTGFGSHARDLSDWEVDLSECRVEYACSVKSEVQEVAA